MRTVRIASWSHVLPTRTSILHAPAAAAERIRGLQQPFIPRGAGRSYGDAAYLTDGITLTSDNLRDIRDLDSENGSVVCQAGVRIGSLFSFLETTPWVFPIGGGTQWTTVGGGVAADVHGKNDVAQGSFGNHVEAMRIALAGGDCVDCSPSDYPDLFAATIGGMGLTGFVESVTLKLQVPPSNAVESRAEVIGSPEAMVEQFRNTQPEFSVAWLDLLHSRFRGIYYQADFVDDEPRRSLPPITIPLPRVKVFNRSFVRGLNAIRFALNADKRSVVRVRDFHHPVDALKHWNQLYGRRGFHEYQFLVAEEHCAAALREFLAGCDRYSLEPFFAVVKKFGTAERKGLLSFPAPGITIMADFANGPQNQAFFSYFTDYLLELGGRIYLAKDSYLTSSQCASMFPRLDEWRQIVQRYDPENRVQSDLSRRLRLKPW